MEIDHLMTRGPLVWEVKSVAWLANILLSSSEHLVYEQDKLGNKQQIESPLPALTGAREEAERGITKKIFHRNKK